MDLEPLDYLYRMRLSLTDTLSGGDLLLIHDEPGFDRYSYSRDQDKKYFTLAWNKGADQAVTIDGTEHNFSSATILPLMFNQTFTFEFPENIVAWQFNREFYCIIDHDAEVSCAGFIFGLGDQVFVSLDEAAQRKMELILQLFIAELNTRDLIQKDMLIMLLKRLIIDITRIAKSGYAPSEHREERLDIFRRFNLLVERNFRKEHGVQFYAQQLNKSAKTLANIFPVYSDKTPVQIIQARVVLEAKQLLSYTDNTVKQITSSSASRILLISTPSLKDILRVHRWNSEKRH